MHSQNNQKWLPSTIDISLKEERSKIDFDQEQLTTLLWGGKESLNRHRHLMDFCSNDPVLKNEPCKYELTREETLEEQYKKMSRLYKLNIEDFTYKNIFYYVLLIGTVI